MLFKAKVLEAIRNGDVTLAFRRWTKPTVRAGGSLLTPIGVLTIDGLDLVDPDRVSEADLRAAGYATRELLVEDLRRSDGHVYRIAFHIAGPDPREALGARADLDEAAIVSIRDSLARLDASGSSDAWTREVLGLIGGKDGRTAAEIAKTLAMEKGTLKRKIRQLKALGLTESLASGYRLSPRGRAYIEVLADGGHMPSNLSVGRKPRI